ncbi:hypothetical protein, partial [Xylanibacter brevis]|uniref:hypothetical protein n=1 Tax=Xylanibacter brevis TaxID=83231 RepID=UPI0026598162
KPNLFEFFRAEVPKIRRIKGTNKRGKNQTYLSFSERKYLKSEGLKVRISEQNPKEKHIFFLDYRTKVPKRQQSQRYE